MERKLNEQWIEVIDGQEHMVKAIEPTDLCQGCLFNGNSGGCWWSCFDDECEMGSRFIIKDLGILNEDGCLPEERTGKYPTIKDRNEYEGWRLFHIWDCIVCEKIGNDDEAIEIRVSALTRQEAIDRWNRRA